MRSMVLTLGMGLILIGYGGEQLFSTHQGGFFSWTLFIAGVLFIISFLLQVTRRATRRSQA